MHSLTVVTVPLEYTLAHDFTCFIYLLFLFFCFLFYSAVIVTLISFKPPQTVLLQLSLSQVCFENMVMLKKIKLIMAKVSRACSRADCIIGAYQYFWTV